MLIKKKLKKKKKKEELILGSRPREKKEWRNVVKTIIKITAGKFFLVGFHFHIWYLLTLILVYRKTWQESEKMCKIYDWKKIPFFFLLAIIGFDYGCVSSEWFAFFA